MIYGTLKESRLKEAIEKALNLDSKIIFTVQIKKSATSRPKQERLIVDNLKYPLLF